jgi:hypothetical protein
VELSLTSEQKIASLTGLKSSLEIEIFNGLARLGIDPDTFSDFTDIDIPMYLTPDKDRITAAIVSLEFVTQKINQLS